VYTIKADRAGFRPAEQKNVVLQVDQQTTIDFELHPLGVSTTVEVTQAAPLLDTESAAIGTDVTNEYVRDIPLYGRSMFGLVFLAGGVTETTGSGINDNYPSGTNFVSNGQRNATAQVTLDGSPISAPEQGEGGNSNVYYQPSVEIVQEFKVQNNSFSAEFGNNGGTIVNMVLKQGGNAFHGSGWWYFQRSATDARDFFNSGPRPDHVRDQYGFSLGGPIQKNKTFFFVDFEKVRQQDPINLRGRVPTDLERTGDFSQSLANLRDPTNPDTAQAGIYDPCAGNPQGPNTPCAHDPFHSLQIRFQKRASHYISFEGNYTFSKATDDSSAGRNAWVGNLGLDNPQVLDNLRVEHGIGSNDAPHRLTAAIIIDLPFGRERWIGGGMNRVLDGIVGGWALNTVVTLQSGNPLALFNSAGLLADGNQRPNVICSQLSSGLSYRDAAKSGGSVLNQGCFGDPGDNIPGNAPRHFSNLRGDGIRNLDTSLSKEFKIHEGQLLQVRAEMFNAFNHQRFAFPDVGSGDGALGQVTSTTNNFRRMQFGARFQF
jgi:hypothetical protein